MATKVTFSKIVCDLCKENDYEKAYELDYFSGHDDVEPMPYDLYYSVTRHGGSEGIYTHFYAQRESDQSKQWIATAKTLWEDDTHYIKMHELAAKVCIDLYAKFKV